MVSLCTDAASSMLQEHRLVEIALAQLVRATKILPRITARNAADERLRLERVLASGELPVPRFEYAGGRLELPAARVIDRLRMRVTGLAGEALYTAKLDELELDLALIAAVGDTRVLRPLVARRFGTGQERVPGAGDARTLRDHALEMLVEPPPSEEPRVLPAAGPVSEPSLALLIVKVADAAGLRVKIRVEPNLAAGAATGDRTVYLAARRFGVSEAFRLAVHEVFGHLTASENGRLQPLRIVEWGTAGSFADQEGVALCIEEHFGLLDARRRRSLAGRVLVTDAMHAGASFGEAARLLFREHGFSANEAITLCERAYRGGGVARDASYLRGHLRVRAALDAGTTTLDELRMGRVSLDALPPLRELVDAGLAVPSRYRPNFSRNFFSTSSGTMPWRSPPSAAASLMSVELT